MKLFLRSILIVLITLTILSGVTVISNLSAKSRPSNVLNLFVWGDFFPESTLKAFEAETGIQPILHFYTSNEDLILKLEDSKGEGYDLIFPSDYAVSSLIEKHLLKEIDLNQLGFLNRIEPFLLNRDFDPDNTYSIPYCWEVYGIAKERETLPPNFTASLALLFDNSEKIIMTDDPVEALALTSHYLFGYKETLSANQERAVIDLLKNQKKYVEAYTDDRVRYMISSKNAPTALIRTSFFWKHFNELSHMEIFLPKEGLFTSIENVSLASKAKHLDAAYTFINFIYKPEIMAAQMQLSPLFPACKDALPHTPFAKIPRYHELLQEIESQGDFYFTHYVIPRSHIRPAWVEVKS